MAGLTASENKALGYDVDVRVKLAGTVVLSLSLAQAELMAVGAAIVFEMGLLFYIQPNLKTLFRRLRPLWVLLALVFTARIWAASGFDLQSIPPASVWRSAVYDGGLVCGRLLAVMLLSILLVNTTRTAHIRSAIIWLFKPIPLIPEKRVATMLSLLLRFIPLIFKQAGDALEAQRARGVDQIKNPVRRMMLLVLPLARRTFHTADQLAVAMEARCYSTEQSISPKFSFTYRDGTVFFITLLASLLMLSTSG